MGQQYDAFFNTNTKDLARRFPLIAIAHDPYQDIDLNLYYIGEDTYVGVHAVGITRWVSPTGNSTFQMLKPGYLAEQIQRAKNNLPIDIEVPRTSTAKVEGTLEIPSVIRRKQIIKRNEIAAQQQLPAIQRKQLIQRRQLIQRKELKRV